MKHLVSAAALSALLLSGCSTTRLPEEMSYAENRALIDEILERCEAQGFKKGSKAYWACGEHEARRERAKRVAAKDRATGARMSLAAGMGAMSQSYINAANTYRPPTNCTTRLAGTFVGQPNRIVTSCY